MVIHCSPMITCRHAAGIVLRQKAVDLVRLDRPTRGFFSRFFRRIDAELTARIPLGYEDEFGFHFGPKPIIPNFQNN